MYEVSTIELTGLKQRGIPTHNSGAVVIHTGLSVVTSCGHVIDLVRDTATKTATVRVTRPDHALPESDHSLVEAANMLAARAQRCLAGWTVVRWAPPRKVAGYIDESWRSGV